LFVMLIRRFFLGLLIFGGLLFPAISRAADLFDPGNFPGAWTLSTNADGTVSATESAIHRQGRVVYSRVLDLQAAPAELPIVNPGAAPAETVRQFIADYRPPAIPYTSERTALKTGREKFNCLEFAEDLVMRARENGIPAQVIGILFKGQWAGHAVAGFPTAEGPTLYFDSTPGAGQISHAAHEAQVQIGEPYTREGGGELAVVGQLPITEIIPVTKLVSLAGSLIADDGESADRSVWVITGVRRVPSNGIDYADTNNLQISDDQLARWNDAASKLLAAKKERQNEELFSVNSAAAKAAAKALAENEELAAQNDPYGQLRMGERYSTGDGVPKNSALGRAYLKQAADQGSPTAIAELKKISGGVLENSN